MSNGILTLLWVYKCGVAKSPSVNLVSCWVNLIALIGIAALAGVFGVALLGTGWVYNISAEGVLFVSILLTAMLTGCSIPVVAVIFAEFVLILMS